MLRRNFSLGFLAAWFLVAASAAAQLSAPEPDPLARMRQAAAANSQTCSESELSACAQAAPKIIANALGASPLAENLRRLTDGIGGRLTGSPAMAKAVEWAVAGFREAGVDDVHTEKFTIPHTWSEGATHVEILSPAGFPGARSLRCLVAGNARRADSKQISSTRVPALQKILPA